MVAIKRPETTVQLCTDAGLQSAWEQASERLRIAQVEAVKDRREAGEPAELVAAKENVRGIEQEMHDVMLVFTLRAMSHKRFAEIEADHPPREENASDLKYGLNLATGIDALFLEPGTVAGVVQKVTGEPVAFDAVTEWKALADEMSAGQFEPFALGVLGVNRGTVTPGFNRAAYVKTRS